MNDTNTNTTENKRQVWDCTVNEVVGSPVSTPSSIREVGGIEQLIGGW